MSSSRPVKVNNTTVLLAVGVAEGEVTVHHSEVGTAAKVQALQLLLRQLKIPASSLLLE